MGKYHLNIFSRNIILILGYIVSISHNCNAENNSSELTSIVQNITQYAIQDLLSLGIDINDYVNISYIIETYENVSSNEDIFLNGTQLLQKYGYTVEEHEVTTSDGYILTLIRIPSNDSAAVLVTHGLLLSSDGFISPGPQNGLAYVLADAGYDVWLANARGTKQSKRHETLSTSSATYWDFSWDEIGRYDQAAMIDYILEKTNKTTLKVAAHSQGLTTSLVLCSEKPEYNDKISVIAGMSPVVFISNTNAPIIRLLAGPLSSTIFSLANLFGYYSIASNNILVKLITTVLCGTSDLATAYCNNLVFAFVGLDYNQINTTSLPVFYGHFPDGIATKQLAHYEQLVSSGKFRQYDYGTTKNLNKYNSTSPPDYSLQNVTTKVAIFHSDNDWMCVKEDLETLVDSLPNVIGSYRVNLTSFSHMDHVFARDAKTLVYDKLLEILEAN